EGSFHEIGKIAGAARYSPNDDLESFTPSTSVMGRATINGRPVVVLGDDFTVRGGAADAAIWRKMLEAFKMAIDYRSPLIQLVDGTGGGGSVKMLEQDPRTYIPETPGWEYIVEGLGRVPFVSLALGPCAGLGAGRVAASHYSVMAKGLSQVFVAGPPVAAALGEETTKEALGGWEIQARNGTVDDAVDTESDAFEHARRFLSYLPLSVDAPPPIDEPTDDPDRCEDDLLTIVPTDGVTPYKPRKIVSAVVDRGSFFEIGRSWGRGIVAGLARWDGRPVGGLAGDPFFLDGAWTADVCDKVIRHVDLCSTFHLPLVHFVDCPGFAVGARHEMAGVARRGVRAMAAIYQAPIPICAIVIRKAYGLAGSAMFNPTRAKWRYCWPSGDWGSLPMAGGIEAAFRKELAEADDPEALKATLYKKFDAIRSPFRTAEAFYAEEIIDPRRTRPLAVDFVRHAYRALDVGPVRFPPRP
ncbi:MAG: carboxyl transferase domain-containing protein, partial [Pseudomonadota bacterium]